MSKDTRSLKELERLAKIYEPLNPQEEDRIVRKAVKGDTEAREKLIKHNARKILFFSKMLAFGAQQPMKEALSYYKGTLSIDDAISETLHAFWKALRYFDPERNSPIAKKKVKFSSWVNLIIRQHLRDVAIKAGKRKFREDEERKRATYVPTGDVDKDLATERFIELLESLPKADRKTLYAGRSKYKPYQKALKKLKSKVSDKEWEDMRRLLF